MWLWMRRWRDWAMNDLWPLYRISPQPQALHYSYEKAGLTLHDQPIPWNAEAVLVEALLRLPPNASRRKGDFLLRLPGQPPVAADQVRRQEGDDRFAVHFRLPPPAADRRRRDPLPQPRPRPADAAVPQPRGVPAKPPTATVHAVRPRRR